MQVKHEPDDFWDVYVHSDYKPEVCSDGQGNICDYNRYKLHISIHPTFFPLVEEEIREVLYAATKAKMIMSYKVLLQSQFDNECVARQKHIPFVIYLNNEFNQAEIDCIIQLCKQIEKILRAYGIPPGEEKALSASDVPLPGHFIFRQTAIKTNPPYEYIYAEDARAPELKRLAIESAHFQAFQKGLQVVELKQENLVVIPDLKAQAPVSATPLDEVKLQLVPKQNTLFRSAHNVVVNMDQKKEENESSCGCWDALKKMVRK